jgi:hypothetical protein
LKTAIILAALTLGVSACSDDKSGAEPKRPTRIVCTNPSGIIVHDDFAVTDDVSVFPRDGYLEYDSDTQKGTVRVTGQCVTYPINRPSGWKPVIQGQPG